MSARDELARVMDEWLDDEAPLNLRRYLPVADAILKVLEPRTITTAEELDALPEESLVLDAHAVGCQKVMAGVWSAGAELITTELVDLPAAVLHEGASK